MQKSIMQERKYNRITLQPKDVEEKKKFAKFKDEKKSTFVWQCVWLTGAALTMLVIYIVRMTMERLVILAFELFICLIAWLLWCLQKRFSPSTFILLLVGFYLIHQVYTTVVCAILVHLYGSENIYILGYILRLWESYAVFVQFTAP